MIAERPVTEYLGLYLEQPVPGVFRLDRSPLDGSHPLGTGTGSEWRDLMTFVTGELDVRRGARPDPAAPTLEVGTLSVTLLDLGSHSTPQPGNAIILALRDSGDALFTGRITEVTVTESKDSTGRWHTYTALAAVDVVTDVANTMRYGALPDNQQGAESLGSRLTRVLASLPPWVQRHSDLSSSYIPSPDNTFVWLGDLDSGALAEVARWDNPNGDATVYQGGIQMSIPAGATASRVISGLKPGRMYAVQLRSLGMPVAFTYGVDNPSPSHVGQWFQSGHIFTAQSGSAVLRIAGPALPAIFDAIVLSEWPSAPHLLAATVHESNVASYLDKTLATVPNGRWWVDPDNVLRVSSVTRPVSAAFTDTKSPGLHYVDIDRGQSSADVVSQVDILALQRGFDDEGRPVSVERTYSLSDETLAATWGARALAVETFAASDDAALALARALLTKLGKPELRPRSVVWNAQEDVSALPSLDVFSRVTVARDGTTHTLDVAAINHRISARRHMVTLDLIP